MPAHSVSVHIPSEVVILVLQHVEVSQRLGVCALVSQAWRAAAAAATISIDITCASLIATQQLLQYFDQQGSSVEHLKLCTTHLQPLARLPCSRLLSLELHHFKLQLSPRNEQPGLLHAATGITRLCLPCGNYFDGRHELAALTVLQKLQHLELMHGAAAAPSNSMSWTLPSATLPGTVLAALTVLTFLHMPVADSSSLAHISSCTALQVLKFPQWDRCGASAAALTGLEHLRRLSYLSISNIKFTLNDAVLSPVLSKLAFLQHLELQSVYLLPSLLVPLTQLQHLGLRHEALPDASPAVGASELLHALSHLLRLTFLDLDLGYSAPTDPVPYSALTASSQLQHLRLAYRIVCKGFEQHLFNPGCPMNHLTALHVVNTRGRYDDVDSDDDGDGDIDAASTGLVELLAMACPKVQELSLHWAAQTGFSALQQLEALTRLDLDGVGGTQLFKQVVALQGLHILRLGRHSRAYVSSSLEVMQIAALTQLACLDLGSGFLPGGLWIRNEAPSGAPSNVGSQLAAACVQATCQRGPAYASQLTEQFVQLHADLARSRADLARCQANLAQSQARVAELEAAAAAQQAAVLAAVPAGGPDAAAGAALDDHPPAAAEVVAVGQGAAAVAKGAEQIEQGVSGNAAHAVGGIWAVTQAGAASSAQEAMAGAGAAAEGGGNTGAQGGGIAGTGAAAEGDALAVETADAVAAEGPAARQAGAAEAAASDCAEAAAAAITAGGSAGEGLQQEGGAVAAALGEAGTMRKLRARKGATAAGAHGAAAAAGKGAEGELAPGGNARAAAAAAEPAHYGGSAPVSDGAAAAAAAVDGAPPAALAEQGKQGRVTRAGKRRAAGAGIACDDGGDIAGADDGGLDRRTGSADGGAAEDGGFQEQRHGKRRKA